MWTESSLAHGAAAPERIIWLGAFGTGASALAAGWTTRTLLKALMGAELSDKVAADTIVLDAKGTVFHPGPLSNGPTSTTRRTVGLREVPRRLFPARISRATVAASMLDEAETSHYAGTTAIPLEREDRQPHDADVTPQLCSKSRSRKHRDFPYEPQPWTMDPG